MRAYKRGGSRLWFLFILFPMVYVFYIEVVTYFWNSRDWFRLKCENPKECARILFVADPQIIGDYQEALHFLTPLSIFDSDRYLKKTYSYAYDFVKPDIVIFLGDLMDEGATANDQEFHGYVRRVFNIFLQYSEDIHVRHIWLPGDNDIGGEDQRVTPDKLTRFQRAFSQPDLLEIKNVTFFKVNRLIESIPVYKQQREFYDSSKIFVGLSHVPLMFKPSVFVEKVMQKMMPQIIFSAHEHKSMIIRTDALLREDFHIIPVTPEKNSVYEYALGVTDMYEIMVPTCSYRMGTKKIGFGYAILEKNELQFTVLWSPSRFEQLQGYLILVMCYVLFGLSYVLCYKCRRRI